MADFNTRVARLPKSLRLLVLNQREYAGHKSATILLDRLERRAYRESERMERKANQGKSEQGK